MIVLHVVTTNMQTTGRMNASRRAALVLQATPLPKTVSSAVAILHTLITTPMRVLPGLMFTPPHSHSLPHSHCAALSLCRTLTLPHSHCASLSLCLALTVPRSHCASLSLCLTLTLPHSHSASLSRCLTLTLCCCQLLDRRSWDSR